MLMCAQGHAQVWHLLGGGGFLVIQFICTAQQEIVRKAAGGGLNTDFDIWWSRVGAPLAVLLFFMVVLRKRVGNQFGISCVD